MTVPAYPDLTGSEPCRQVDPELFHPDPDNGVPLNQVKALCRPCDVREQCLAYAITHDVSGVWGGTSEAQRRRIRRSRGIKAVPIMPVVDRDLVVRAHLRGMPTEAIARLIDADVDNVVAMLSRWRRKQEAS